MSLKEKRVWLLAGFVLIIFAFYWYSLRPHLAKQSCMEKADRFSRSGSGVSFEDMYDNCLLRKGLK